MATTPKSTARYHDIAWRWFDSTILDLGRQMRWSYLPPLMVYVAAGISGLTAIVGTFFVKEHFGFSAAFLAGLGFWGGIPWTLKMPLGHLVDIVWRWKALLVYLGATLIALSVAIMYALIAHTERMADILSLEAWYVLGSLLAPVGYVLQDVVADAMTVEAVPNHDERGEPYPEAAIKMMHTTMQTLGRVAIIGALVAVAAVNIFMFAGIEQLSEAAKKDVYADIYLSALVIPIVSVVGVTLGAIGLRRRAANLRRQGLSEQRIAELTRPQEAPPKADWRILGGGAAFVAFILATGLSSIPYDQEIIFVGSMASVLFLMSRLFQELSPENRGPLIGTAVIIFVFRAVPLPGSAVTWWQIDVLGFDQQFFAVLSLITSGLTLVGMVILRPMMARRTIADVVVILSVVSGLLSLPIIGLYYGLHEWTSHLTGGIVDARFIAILDTAIESPLAQVSMIPMLAWIAKNAPSHLKATFFAVMASFTNLALSASSLLTKYLNGIFVVEREVRDRATNAIQTPADYHQLGWLLVVVTVLTVALPLLATAAVQATRLRTRQ